MEQTSRGWHLLAVALLLLLLLSEHKQTDAAAATTNDTEPSTGTGSSVKKSSPQSPPPHTELVTQLPAVQAKATATERTVVINEQQQKKLQPAAAAETKAAAADNVMAPVDNVHKEHTKPKDNMDFPDSFTPMYYIFVAVSSAAILLLVARVYRLRLSRAERKYGVQGDRANQELTPLPMAIEDVNSDEDEDHTLFEVNRQSIRIL